MLVIVSVSNMFLNLINCIFPLLLPSDLCFWLPLSLHTYCSHYFVHGGWFPKENYLLDNVDTIRHIPATIIQGRYDVVTPMKTAWDLHKVIRFSVLLTALVA